MPSSARSAILTYHSIDDSGSVLSTAPRIFAEQMRILYEQGYAVALLDTVLDNHHIDPLSKGRVAITFDDGFRNVYEHALPVLQRYGFPATVFLVTDYCGKANDWPGQPAHVHRHALLSWPQIREMSAAGMTFGSHTRTHPNLRAVALGDMEEELRGSKCQIEDAIGRPVTSLAYPYGGYSLDVKRLAGQCFTIACTTTLDFVRLGSDRLALERLDTYYLRHPTWLRRLFSPEMDAYVGFRRYLRKASQRVLVNSVGPTIRERA